MSHDSGVRFEQFVNDNVVYKSLVTTRCKPREGGNNESVLTMTGWKPRKFGNEKYLIAHNFFTHEETCTDDMNVTEHKSYKIVMRTCSKTQKYPIAHNFNFDRNIGMLHLKMIVLMRGIQLNKNF